MDVEKLIRRLRNDADAYRNGETLGRAFADQEDVLDNAATALSTLRAENEKLRAESIMHHNAADNYFSELTEYRQERNEALAELEQVVQKYETAVKLQVKMTEISNRQMAELEQAKQERDEAVQCIRRIAKSGRVWMCPYCVHAKDTTGGIAECELDVGVCMMPYSKFEWRGQKED